ncbi:putative DNA primase [Lactobacillus gasseri 224-1]|uniref:Putative DNA primase n=1 Tax=Lactobacillus gasseri 224-1 TaxID=679196 RepID=D1YIN5_LACGS|nr:putative DNA primase [Lactobacillus gasseri 224-1]
MSLPPRKTPSFTVSEGKQFFKCFGCGKGGNVFKFLMYQDHLTFPESVKKAAELAHLQMPEGYGEAAKPLSPLKKMYRQATEFYQHILLTTKVGERALEYARKRELTDDLLKHFKVGYAPDDDKILLTYLQQKKEYTDNDLRESGLFIESQDGQLFDRFRDRLMFPLGDESGYTVGFSGRRISNDKTIAKYMNSPETKIFNKSKLLFHFAEAKKAARSEKHLILYEGYMDVIAAYKAGIQSGVASMGTSLTTEQVYMLRRITPNILVNYDGDPPGIHAAERATKLFGQVQGFNLGIIVLPENLDPDEYVKNMEKKSTVQKLQVLLVQQIFYLKD